MKHLLLYISFVLFSASSLSSQSIQLNGIYNGKNLFLTNPSFGNSGFCVDSIIINHQHSKDELNSNAIEIDFSLMNIKAQSTVEVIIYHKKACTPQIMNPDAIKQQFNFTIDGVKVNKNQTISWKINGKADVDSFSVQQFKWKKWLLLGKVEYKQGVSDYSAPVRVHSGYNMFRICKSNGNVCSANAKFTSTAKAVSILDPTPSLQINFSAETIYELYDNKGILIEAGEGKEIPLKGLPKGEYWVNFDNKTEKITKSK